MKRLRENDIELDELPRTVVKSAAITPSVLDILVLDIFTYMGQNEFISSTDMLMLAWVYVPVRCLVPEDLKGAKNLVFTVYSTGELNQIEFVAREMKNHLQWSPFNMWLGFLCNPLNTYLFDDMTNPKLTPYPLPLIDTNIHLGTMILHTAIKRHIDYEMLSGFFNYVHPDLVTAYQTLQVAMEEDYGPTYIDALSDYGLRAFSKETWNTLLRREDYDALALVMTLDNDPPHINLLYDLLSHDNEDAMDVLHDAGLLRDLDRGIIYECIDNDKLCTVAKLIEFGIFKPVEEDLNIYEDSDAEDNADDIIYNLSSEMMALLTKAIAAQKALKKVRS